MKTSLPNCCLIVFFLATLAAPGLIQIAVEVRSGELPRALEVFWQSPTPANLRAYDKMLEDTSATTRTLRPWIQVAQFFVLEDAGDKTVVGRDGWFFYKPGVDYLTQRRRPNESTASDAVAAVVHFRDQLAARGIQLLVMPAPNKESIYPDELTRFATAPTQVLSEDTRSFLDQCHRAGVEVIDLFALYRVARGKKLDPLYLAQDSHWSPAGMELAVAAVADRISARGWLARGTVAYDRRPITLHCLGDIVRMVRSPQLEERITPDVVECTQVLRSDDSKLYADDPQSEVLVLGDSFLRMYEKDPPGGAGLVAHLAIALGRPLASIINEGGGATLVRQQLARRPQMLHKTKVVIWEFVERDLRLGTEGWQVIHLPHSNLASD